MMMLTQSKSLLPTMITALTIMFTQASNALQDEPKTGGFIVQIYQLQLDLRSNGGVLSTCALVTPQATLHVEKRVQRLPKRKATLKIFESKLTSAQLQDLRRLLDEDNIRTLPTFVFPTGRVGTHGFSAYEAKIARGTQVQDVGYVKITETDLTSNKFTSSNKNLDKSGSASEKALDPLLQWLNDVTPRLAVGYGHSTLCEVMN